MSAFRLPPAIVLVAVLLDACAGVPPGLEKQWADRQAAQWDLEMCIHGHVRNPSACSAAKAAYDAAVKEYGRAANSEHR
jgi:hypothetical protein